MAHAAAVDLGESTPATAATPRAGPARPDPARRPPVTPRKLGFTPFRGPPPPPQEGALPNSPEEIQSPEWKPYVRSQALPETAHVTTPVSWVKSTREALTHKAFAYELHAQLDAQILVNADLTQGKPPAKSAPRPVRNPPPLGTETPATWLLLSICSLLFAERALTDSSEEIQAPEWKPYAGSQAVPDTEVIPFPLFPSLSVCHAGVFAHPSLPSYMGVRTPGSSLKNTCEALAHEAFTDEQHAQLYAHILINADLKQGKPPSKAAMVLAFGRPVEGQKHAWEEVWRAALDRYQKQMSPLGFETPFSSQKNGPLEPSPISMKNLEEFELKEAHSELVDAQTSKWQNQKSPVTGFETPIKSVIGNCAAQGLDVQNGEELAVSCTDKVDQESPDGRNIMNTMYGRLESLCGSTPLESSESLTEQDSCVKCGKDGQLLKCSSCFLAAHATCFGSSVTFDDSGYFDCPFCYCHKADKALERAKKTKSEAWKNLSVFCSGSMQFCKEPSEQSTGNQQRHANFEDQMNGFHTAKKQGNHQSEAAELCRKDEEPSHLFSNI
ncbi:uncharacterized protein LOC125507623 [Triticum urartu]|uniref:uncharacterized protein LOC125507623 n=1 Tax=Triticum urartu TaxID=4572 RepID=UPI00204310B3|nr:uncharacterized protein LOC125507623 [Triticum urartu]